MKKIQRISREILLFYFRNIPMIFGMNREKMKSATEKKTLKEMRFSQLPLAQTSLRVAMKKVKINVPTIMPKPVPAK